MTPTHHLTLRKIALVAWFFAFPISVAASVLADDIAIGCTNVVMFLGSILNAVYLIQERKRKKAARGNPFNAGEEKSDNVFIISLDLITAAGYFAVLLPVWILSCTHYYRWRSINGCDKAHGYLTAYGTVGSMLNMCIHLYLFLFNVFHGAWSSTCKSCPNCGYCKTEGKKVARRRGAQYSLLADEEDLGLAGRASEDDLSITGRPSEETTRPEDFFKPPSKEQASL